MDISAIKKLLLSAGVEVDGKNQWDVHVRDERTYGRVLRDGSLGFGEAYMDGWWDAEKLDEFFDRILRFQLERNVSLTLPLIWQAFIARIMNRQARTRAFNVGERHYDTGNDIFEPMLGKTMAYSCGYWDSSVGGAKNLDEAQEAKFDLICRKTGLKPGMRILDIGCGWGTFMKYAVEHYGVSAVGVTVSKEQAEWAKTICAGLPIEIRLEDYRNISESFDCVISIGMFEHVGYKNYRSFMRVVARCLKDDGLFLLHTIGSSRSAKTGDTWMEKYIFPGGQLPSIRQIGGAIEDIFIMEDWHNFGADYDKTLMAWYANFEKSWPSLKEKYGDRFYRMWKYYLLSCAGAFRSRKMQLWQIVLSKKGVLGGWRAVR